MKPKHQAGMQKGSQCRYSLRKLKKTRSKARLKEDIILKGKRKKKRTRSAEILVRRNLLMWHQRQRKCINSGQRAASLKENMGSLAYVFEDEDWKVETRMGSTEEEDEAKRDRMILIERNS